MTTYHVLTSVATDGIVGHKFIWLLLKLIHKDHDSCLPEIASFLDESSWRSTPLLSCVNLFSDLQLFYVEKVETELVWFYYTLPDL